MPVDPSALVEAVIDVLSRIPSGIVVALLLGGPTAIWLILRLLNPRDARSRYGSVASDPHWICTECRSLNENRNDRCYRCLMARTDAVLPLLAGTPPADTIGVGIPVGPGLPVGSRAADWLAEEVEEDLDGIDGFDEADGAEGVSEPAHEEHAPVMAVPTPATPIFEPLALEPRVKPARKARSPRASRRG
ncbi:MAG TPA: hypothetical protein VFO73_03595 [Candidatus Limnocylindrales bacterium]|nr:hypothetical protein [Candidatus Limnocylindrales bacterium]